MKVRVPIGLDVVIELEAPEGADRAAVAAFVHAVVDQIGLKVADVVGHALADLARLEAAVETLGDGEFGPRQRQRQASGVRDELRRVRGYLRPLDVELWGAAFRRRIESLREDGRRAASASDAGAPPKRLEGGDGE